VGDAVIGRDLGIRHSTSGCVENDAGFLSSYEDLHHHHQYNRASTTATHNTESSGNEENHKNLAKETTVHFMD